MQRWRSAIIAAACALVLGAAACAPTSAPTAGSPTSGDASPTIGRLPVDAGRPLPTPLRGLTVDRVDELPALVESVARLDQPPTLRIVFDLEQDPEHYAAAIEALRPHAYLMGLLLDSTDLAEPSVEQVRARAEEYLAAFDGQIDIWEVGNELNGEWVGSGPDEINAKALAALEVVQAHGARSAITLNYWQGPGCYAQPWEATLPFAAATPDGLRGVDYLLLSVYETACDPAQRPSAADLAEALTELGGIFPGASLGIGEIGAQGRPDGLPAEPTLATKEQIAERYYGQHAELTATLGDRFVGGYFWWYYVTDAVPYERDETLWPSLNELLNSLG